MSLGGLTTAMDLVKLGHYAIRTPDLEASRRFYTDVLRLRAGFRPPFDFPGLWLYLGDDESEFGVVHLIGTSEQASVHRYLGKRAHGDEPGSGRVDHIAFLARGWPAMRARCQAHGVAYSERLVPSLGLLQVFLVDPSGVTVELNYPPGEVER